MSSQRPSSFHPSPIILHSFPAGFDNIIGFPDVLKTPEGTLASIKLWTQGALPLDSSTLHLFLLLPLRHLLPPSPSFKAFSLTHSRDQEGSLAFIGYDLISERELENLISHTLLK